MEIQKYDIVLVDLNPVKGSEQQGVRPCMVVQHNEVNRNSTVTVVCPFSSILKKFFFTLIVEASRINGLSSASRLDILQIRAIDKSRICKKIGKLDESYRTEFKQRFFDAFDLEDLF